MTEASGLTPKEKSGLFMLLGIAGTVITLIYLLITT